MATTLSNLAVLYRSMEQYAKAEPVYRDDVQFVDAWVSPKGTIIAITKQHVYRLD